MSKTSWYAKPVYLMVALALVLSLGITALPMAGTVEARCHPEVWVDDDADPGWYGGNHVHTIQEAIDVICFGGTVHVLPGTYDGDILVDVENVTIESTDGPEVTTVSGPGDVGFEVIEPGVIIDGFTITGFYGGCAAGSSVNDISHSLYIGGSGILLTGVECAHHCIIKNNTIVNNYTAIMIFTAFNLILSNRISNNAYGDSGIHLGGYASGNEIRCNDIYGNFPGLVNDTAGTVIATNNWWGCSEGPGAAGCDTVVGDVLVDPWLPSDFESCEECRGTPPSPPGAPAVNQWGIIAMITLLSGLLVWTIRRKRLAS